MRGALASARRLVPFRGRAALQHLADIEDAGLSAEGEAPIGQDLRENFYVATRDNFRTQTLTEVMLEVGADRMLYSVDYPFEDMALAANWIDHAAISDSDRSKTAGGNARKLCRLQSARLDLCPQNSPVLYS